MTKYKYAFMFSKTKQHAENKFYSWPARAHFFVSFMSYNDFPDSNVQGANMGPNWVLSAPDGPRVGPMNIAIWVTVPFH